MRYTRGRYSAIPRRDWGGALTGASSGFKMGTSVGAMFGPIGGAIGGGLGAITGALFGNKAENDRNREQAKQDKLIADATLAEKNRAARMYKGQVRSNDLNYLDNFKLNSQSSLYSANGRKIATNGKRLSGGSKLLTKNGSTAGSHESGANIPIKQGNEIVAIAEPGEVLVNDKSISKVPFVLSKRLGYAQEFMRLEGIKNIHNADIIENRQSKLVEMNNSRVSRKKIAAGGLNLGTTPVGTSNISIFKERNLPGIQKYNGTKPTTLTTGNKSSKLLGGLGKIDIGSTMEVAGTIGNLVMSNKALKRQKGLIKNSLDQALSYTPNLNKNYLLNDTVDVNDQVSSINQGYNTSVAGLEGIDPAISSALKNTASIGRSRSLGSVFANKNNIQTSIRNQNTAGIMTNNASNNSLLNDTALMKLNAKIAANEQLGDAESARLSNVQGALSEFNNITRDKQMIKSLDARWKDSIGTDYRACGGRVGKKRKRTMAR